MKKKLFIGILIFVILLLLLGIVFYTVDKTRVENGQKPIFCIKNPAGEINDGGTIEYFGLGYKVIDYNKLNGYDKIHIGSWDLKYDTSLGEANEENGYTIFYGKVLDVLGIYEEVGWVNPTPGPIQITIEPEQNEEIRKSSDKIVTYLKEYDGSNYEVGTKVKVIYKGEIRESYPAQVDCISIEEIENKTINMYEKILEDLIKQDSALNTDAKFIAIDFENFKAYHKDRNTKEDQMRSLSPNEKQTLLDYCRKYNENVIESNFKELKEQGYFNEETMSLDGILISIDNIEKMKEDKVILRASKYRSALGAVMPKYEFNLVNEYYWNFKIIDIAIS